MCACMLSHFSLVWLFATPWTAAWLPCPSLSPAVCSNSCPLSWWCHLTISSFFTPFFLPSFPASGSFPMSQLCIRWPMLWSFSFITHGSNEVWFPLGLTGLFSQLPKGLSRVFSSTAVWKHQFFGDQPNVVQLSHSYMITGVCLVRVKYMALFSSPGSPSWAMDISVSATANSTDSSQWWAILAQFLFFLPPSHLFLPPSYTKQRSSNCAPYTAPLGVSFTFRSVNVPSWPL